MNEFWAIIYGIIQGLTEFLPVSSSGHLALLPKFAHFKDPGLVFDLAMHLGTALAVALYFYKAHSHYSK
ncbi:undecaprenyl-diphosphate phosphatase [Bacteriovorax sp. DB6_IX]|uniref:undecaprenyl-diphosphate phosphatase n=1 Tax=Bacteriovorax sp. DB6_IX TaxID=1353530 RepID=UPI00038A1B58|nr:undecaprenyl-diphosphate phosphatase [Bacteriovorax sp. DB6_IX]EQC52786.1 undecaprenol kinase domain protein [Bacteriovorax sp. DB6_IX]